MKSEKLTSLAAPSLGTRLRLIYYSLFTFHWFIHVSEVKRNFLYHPLPRNRHRAYASAVDSSGHAGLERLGQQLFSSLRCPEDWFVYAADRGRLRMDARRRHGHWAIEFGNRLLGDFPFQADCSGAAGKRRTRLRFQKRCQASFNVFFAFVTAI